MAGRRDPGTRAGGSGRQPVGDSQMLTVRVPKDIHDALRTLSFATGKSINDIVLKAIGDYLGSQGHRDAVEGFMRRAQDRYRVALDKLADM
jgi:predicted transcriptional regulator